MAASTEEKRLLDENQSPPGEERTEPGHRDLKLYGYLCVKYSFDFIAALLLSAVLFLPMMVIALCIRIDSKGPAIFSQLRVGKDGREFRLYKFRTMDLSAPHDLATSRFPDADRYITKPGAFLRRTSLDELPQLWNVLKGEMSFVGFRPVCTTEINLNNLRREYGVFDCRPGITGLAQVRGRDDLYYRDKAKVDAEYVRNRSLKLDLYCLLQTIPVTLSQKGAK